LVWFLERQLIQYLSSNHLSVNKGITNVVKPGLDVLKVQAAAQRDLVLNGMSFSVVVSFGFLSFWATV
jgi:hypothetical protein